MTVRAEEMRELARKVREVLAHVHPTPSERRHAAEDLARLEVLATLEPASIQCVVTSPPYWGLRDYGVPGQLGLEITPDLYVEAVVEVFREVRRVLRPDGVAWLNLGDSYAARSGLSARRNGQRSAQDSQRANVAPHRNFEGLKHKDLVGIPWRTALALQTDGWWLRADVVWAKPNPMPESVRDRPTRSHEYVFLLAQRRRYFYDGFAIREGIDSRGGGQGRGEISYPVATANRKSVWHLPTEPFPEAHFATFPTALVEPCVRAGTSDRGACPTCGAPWRRIVGPVLEERTVEERTVGWELTCRHAPAREPVPCLVLDPFAGSGTAGVVARRLGRRFVGVELNPEYAAMARRRIEEEGEGVVRRRDPEGVVVWEQPTLGGGMSKQT